MRARLVLWRLSPPFRRGVEVHRVTVGGFLELVRAVAPKAAAAILASKGPLTDIGLIRACADADTVAAFADLVTVDQPVGYLRPWLHGRMGGFFARRNTDALLAACRQVEGDGQWTRFLGTLNRGTPAPGQKKEKGGGGLMADILMLAAFGYGSPAEILGWPMQDFLSLCEAINIGAKASGMIDPTLDPDAEASDVTIPGLWTVH